MLPGPRDFSTCGRHAAVLGRRWITKGRRHCCKDRLIPVSACYLRRCRDRLRRRLPTAGRGLLDCAPGPLAFDEYLACSRAFECRIRVHLSEVALRGARRADALFPCPGAGLVPRPWKALGAEVLRTDLRGPAPLPRAAAAETLLPGLMGRIAQQPLLVRRRMTTVPARARPWPRLVGGGDSAAAGRAAPHGRADERPGRTGHAAAGRLPAGAAAAGQRARLPGRPLARHRPAGDRRSRTWAC